MHFGVGRIIAIGILSAPIIFTAFLAVSYLRERLNWSGDSSKKAAYWVRVGPKWAVPGLCGAVLAASVLHYFTAHTSLEKGWLFSFWMTPLPESLEELLAWIAFAWLIATLWLPCTMVSLLWRERAEYWARRGPSWAIVTISWSVVWTLFLVHHYS